MVAGVSIFMFHKIESPITRALSPGFSVGVSLSEENLLYLLNGRAVFSSIKVWMRVSSSKIFSVSLTISLKKKREKKWSETERKKEAV